MYIVQVSFQKALELYQANLVKLNVWFVHWQDTDTHGETKINEMPQKHTENGTCTNTLLILKFSAKNPVRSEHWLDNTEYEDSKLGFWLITVVIVNLGAVGDS